MNKEQIKIKLFKEVSIEYNNNEIILSKVMGKKLINVFMLLALKNGKPVSSEEIHAKLWPESSDAKQIIKYSIFRLRKELSEIDSLEGLDIIETSEDGYMLSRNYEYEIDTVVFEGLYMTNIDPFDKITAKESKIAIEIIKMYKGRLYLTNEAPFSLVTQGNKLSSYYSNTVQKLSEYLLDNELYDSVAKINLKIVEIEPFLEIPHYYYLKGLIGSNKFHEALVYYDAINERHIAETGLNLSPMFNDLYIEIVNKTNENKKEKRNIDYVETDLKKNIKKNGAFYCTYAVFKNIYEISAKTAKRYGGHVFIILFTIDKVSRGENIVKTSSYLKEIIEDSIREADVFTRLNERQFVILSLSNDRKKLFKVIDRICPKFYRRFNSNKYRLSYDVREISL